jgi:hypothetical protein
MRAILPPHLPHIDQPDKGLVDQRGGLQGVADAFVRHVAACEAAQLVMDERHQPFQRGLIAAAPVDQQPRDISRTIDHLKTACTRKAAAAVECAARRYVCGHVSALRCSPCLRSGLVFLPSLRKRQTRGLGRGH